MCIVTHFPLSSHNYLSLCYTVVVDCGPLGNPPNGEVMTMGTLEGAMAVYACNPGFLLEGEMSRTCQGDGQWSGSEPVCAGKNNRNYQKSNFDLL